MEMISDFMSVPHHSVSISCWILSGISLEWFSKSWSAWSQKERWSAKLLCHLLFLFLGEAPPVLFLVQLLYFLPQHSLIFWVLDWLLDKLLVPGLGPGLNSVLVQGWLAPGLAAWLIPVITSCLIRSVTSWKFWWENRESLRPCPPFIPWG